MLNKRSLFAVIATFIVIFVFDMIFHGNILMGIYQDTASLWRTPEEMQQYFSWSVFNQLLLATVAVWIFQAHYEQKGMMEGVRFGIYIGTLMGVLQFSIYPYMPIPLNLAIAWLIGAIVQGVCIGATIAVMLKRSGN